MQNKVQALQTTQPARPTALGAMARRINVEPEKLMGALSATCFKGASPEQMLALVVVSNEYGLNPFLREIYAYPAKGGGIVPVIAVDGWLKMVNRAPNFDGLEFEFEDDADGKLFSCTAIISLKDRSKPVKVTEFFSECFRKTDPWENMPRRMLRHKALIQAARIAFGFSGVQDEDEALDVVGTVVVEEKNVRQLPKNQDAPPVEPPPATGTVREEFERLLDENAISFPVFQHWADQSGNVPDATSYPSLADVPEEILKRLLRAKVGLINGLKQAKATMSV